MFIRIVVGDRKYSANDVLEELDKKSEGGMDFYKSHVWINYVALPKSPEGLSMKEISYNSCIEREAKRLGLEKNLV